MNQRRFYWWIKILLRHVSLFFCVFLRVLIDLVRVLKEATVALTADGIVNF